MCLSTGPVGRFKFFGSCQDAGQLLHVQGSEKWGGAFCGVDRLVLGLVRVDALAAMELRLDGVWCVRRMFLEEFVFGVLLAACRKFRGACNGEAVEVLDDAP